MVRYSDRANAARPSKKQIFAPRLCAIEVRFDTIRHDTIPAGRQQPFSPPLTPYPSGLEEGGDIILAPGKKYRCGTRTQGEESKRHLEVGRIL